MGVRGRVQNFGQAKFAGVQVWGDGVGRVEIFWSKFRSSQICLDLISPL